MSLKAKIEAVLFLTAKPIKAQAMARIVNADVQLVRQALLELVHDYEERQGGLEIASDDEGYSFQVKDEYASLMDEFLPVEMSAALIRTLSAIAIKQPITQSEIIRIRGAGAYEHIKELVNRELVAKKEGEGGRSPILSTTKKFQEYFRLTKEGKELRNFLKQQIKKVADGAAAAATGRLAIPNVVSPEADTQLNNQIFLETAESSNVQEESVVTQSSEQAGVQVQLTTEPNEIQLPPPPQAVASQDEAEFAGLHEQQPEVREQGPEVKEAQAQPDEEETEVEANVTLSKLAAAADVKDPEPIIVAEPAPAVTEDPASPMEESEDTTAHPATTSRSTVQSHKAKDGPAIGTSKNGKKQPKLSDLLEKQRELEKALEKAREDSVQQKKIDFSLPPPPKPSDNNTLPS